MQTGADQKDRWTNRNETPKEILSSAGDQEEEEDEDEAKSEEKREDGDEAAASKERPEKPHHTLPMKRKFRSYRFTFFRCCTFKDAADLVTYRTF